MRRKVFLHGRLRKQFGSCFELDVATASEAIRALALRDGFLAELRKGQYRVVRGGLKDGTELSMESLDFGLGRQHSLHIVPVASGHGRGGAGKILMGVALIAATVITSGAAGAMFGAASAGGAAAGGAAAGGAAAGAAAGAATTAGGMMAAEIMGGNLLGITYAGLAKVGLSMAIAGIATALSPAPKGPSSLERPADRPSYLLGGQYNSYEQGNPVPLIYGRVRVGATLISGGVDIVQLDLQDNPVESEGVIGDGGVGGNKGGKGGSGKGGATEDANTLRNTTIARFLDLLGEGEIVGLVDPLTGAVLDKDNYAKACFLDNTPVMDSNGVYNFQGVTIEQRWGLPDQDYVSGFPAVESEVSLGTEIKTTQPLVRSIDDPDCDWVRLRIETPAMTQQDKDDGDLHGSEIDIEIDRRVTGGAWELVKADKIKGKTVSPYQRAYRIDKPAVTPLGWDIRVRRVTADNTAVNISNKTFVAGYTVVTDGKFSYPDSAYIAVEIDARQFGSSVPNRTYEVKGRRIKVPKNYNPETRVYATTGPGTTAGMWDGTFKTEWSDNPAWIVYDLLTDPRAGLGRLIPATQVDKWQIFRIAQYCDQSIPDGFGSYEPRFRFNGVLSTREDAYRVLQSIASTFRGMAYWSAGQIFFSADMPDDPVKLVTAANVVGGEFSYAGTALKARHTATQITWFDPDDHYRPILEIVEHPEEVTRRGWLPIEITQFGCVSRGQARRYGKWVLDSEQSETETVTYRASMDHADLLPGEIVNILDPSYAGVRHGGRIAVPSANVLKLDGAVTMLVGETYQLSVVLPDGVVETRPVLTGSGTTDTLQVSPPFSRAPQVDAVWVLIGSDVEPRQFRVLSVREAAPNLFEVTALLHDRNKYGRVEQGLTFDPIPYYRVPEVQPPRNLKAVETLYFQDGVPKVRVTLSWTSSYDFSTIGYVVGAITPGGTYVPFGGTLTTSLDITDAQPGDWTFQVSARGVGDRLSSPASLTYEVLGWSDTEIASVSHLELVGRGEDTTFGGRDAAFTWRANFPATGEEMGAERRGAGTTYSDPFFRGFVIRVFDPTTNTLLRTTTQWEVGWTYTYEMNAQDAPTVRRTASRTFRVEVSIRDYLGRESKPAKITVSNPVPKAPSPTLRTTASFLYVEYPPSTDLDVVGCLIWVSTTPGFDPEATPPSYDGPQNLVQIAAEPFSIVYVRVALYDEFGRDGLDYSAEQQIAIGGTVIDTEAPAIPSGLALTTKLTDDPSVALIEAAWDASAAQDFAYFDVQIRAFSAQTGLWGSYVSSLVTQPGASWQVPVNVLHGVIVRAFDINGNDSGFADEKQITSSRDSVAPGQPMQLTAQAVLGTVFLTWTNPADSDLDYLEVWEATEDRLEIATLVEKRRGNTYTRALPTNTARYYWVRAVDTSGNAGPYSDADGPGGTVRGVKAQPPRAVADDLADAAIEARNIKQGILDKTMFAAGLEPVVVVAATSALPAASATGPQVVLWAKDGKLYRRVGSTWTAAVPSSDLSGQLLSTQIGPNTIDTGHLRANSVKAGQIESNAVLTGHLSAGAVKAEQLDVGAVRAEHILARQISGELLSIGAIDDPVLIKEGTVLARHVKSQELTTDHLKAGEINASVLKAGTITGTLFAADAILPKTITVADSPLITLDNVLTWSKDPASRINALTTRIDPGRIVIYGATTLNDWRAGPDSTEISGGAVKANSLTANKLEIGSRGLIFSGLQFEPNAPVPDSVAWTAGTITWTDDTGTVTTTAITAGAVKVTGSTTLYIFWVKGAAALGSSLVTSDALRTDRVLLATYKGGSDLNANYGRTVIDASGIKTNSITANLLVSDQAVITGTAQIKDLIVTTQKIVDLTADKVTSGTLQATTAIKVGGDGFVIDAGLQRLTVRLPNGTPMVELGKIGPNSTDYGIVIRNSAGAVLFGSSGFGSGVIPKAAISGLGALAAQDTVSAGQVTGLGTLATSSTVAVSQVSGLGGLATSSTVDVGLVQGLGSFATISQINRDNATTFIAATSLNSAHIESLSASQLTAGYMRTDTFIQAGNNTILDGQEGGRFYIVDPRTSNLRLYAGHMSGVDYGFWLWDYAGNEIFGSSGLQGTYIRDATVGTLKIGANAVTVPVAARLASRQTGSGGGVVVLTSTIVLSQPGILTATASLAQSYPSGPRSYIARIYIDGNIETERHAGASSFDESPALIATRAVGAGSHTVQLWWWGQNNGIFLDDAAMFSMGAMR